MISDYSLLLFFKSHVGSIRIIGFHCNFLLRRNFINRIAELLEVENRTIFYFLVFHKSSTKERQF